MNANRIRDVDFWRGAVLIAIVIDHIPGNPLENWDSEELRPLGQRRGVRLSIRPVGRSDLPAEGL